MKIKLNMYGGPVEFNNVEGYAPTEHYFTIMYIVDGKTVETIIPRSEILRIDVFHSVNLVEEMSKEAASEAARKQLTLPGM